MTLVNRYPYTAWKVRGWVLLYFDEKVGVVTHVLVVFPTCSLPKVAIVSLRVRKTTEEELEIIPRLRVG